MSTGDCGNGGGGSCECGCCCVHNKMEDIKPHPVMEQLPGVQYCINSPPPLRSSLSLSPSRHIFNFFVFAFALLSYLMLLHCVICIEHVEKAKVIQTLLFVSGLNTLTQSLFGTRLPSVIGGSYAFIIPMTSILHAERYHLSSPEPYGDYCTYHVVFFSFFNFQYIFLAVLCFSDSGISGDFQKFERTMRGMQGALIVTSCFQMLIGFLGVWRNVVRFLTPLSMVPLMTFTGLGLYYLGFSMYLPHYAKAKIKTRVCDRYALLFSVAFVWGYAQILTSSGAYHNSSSATQASCRTDRAGLITGAPWLYIPYPFQWGRPTFQAGEAFATMAASFVASLESTGTFLATARYGSATPVPASVVSRGVGWLFNDMVTVIFTSHPTVAVLVAVILDCTLVREDDEGGKDSGSHWWEKFVFYNRDVRSHDFYKLPCKLNKLFPPV
ncbi:hypothetical protein RHMOL_Rhmol06G0077400 [Rhododendron molle]|uniref:Uncharacterized protein n=1 Tax=Rhododendron molle TaxID=49168 RepID=A0ACC0NA12_RHOML|nr:hypothetical protein RHMOL_Rhmol06G0077400 [Rhododendron molle]